MTDQELDALFPCAPRKQFTLTQRQRFLASCMLSGITTNKDLANTAHVTEGTVKIYVSQMLRRTGAVNKTQLILVLARKATLDFMRLRALELDEWIKTYGDNLMPEAHKGIKTLLGSMAAEVLKCGSHQS